MTIRTIIADVASAIAHIVGRVQMAARADAACAWCFAHNGLHRQGMKLLPVQVPFHRYDGCDLTRAPFPGYAATRTGRRSC